MAQSMRMLMVAVAALVGACAAPPPPPPPPPSPVALDPDAACLKDLRDHGVAFEPLAEVASPASPACRIANPVKVTGEADIGWNHAGVLSCAMMQAVTRFETEVVQPAAHRYFGQKVARLLQMGTYECRARRTDSTVAAAAAGKPVRGGRLSEHSRGQAIDVGGFELADGRTITVRRDWRAGGPAGAFLHEVAQGACERFSVVLTPNYNAVHADHMHLDIGPHKLCGL